MTPRQLLERAVVWNMTMATQTEMRWGFDDCALWAVEPIRRALGYDAAAVFRGRYQTKAGAARVLGQGGLAAALRNAARKFGWKRINPKMAHAGDLGLFENGGVYSMVVCRSSGWFVGRNETGCDGIPASLVKIAFKVV